MGSSDHCDHRVAFDCNIWEDFNQKKGMNDLLLKFNK